MKRSTRTTAQKGRFLTGALLVAAFLAAAVVTWAVGENGQSLGADGVAAVIVGVGLATLWALAGRAAGLVWVMWRGE